MNSDMVVRCYHASVTTRLFPRACFHAPVTTRLFPRACYHALAPLLFELCRREFCYGTYPDEKMSALEGRQESVPRSIPIVLAFRCEATWRHAGFQPETTIG